METTEEIKRQMISCFKGLAPISFPKDWTEGFDYDHSFSSVDGEARIKFANGRAFGVTVSHNGPSVTSGVRELSAEEITSTDWGGFQSPWESYDAAQLFGHGKITRLE